MTGRLIKGILFDKDGTLFHFHQTWSPWAKTLISDYSDGDNVVALQLAQAIGFDLGYNQFQSDSMIIAGTNRQAAELVAQVFPDRDVESIEQDLSARAAQAAVVSPVDLPNYLDNLAQAGLALGVMTNDTEYAARSQLRMAQVEGLFDFIAGFDSGFGAKPNPDPLLAFADQLRLEPAKIIMVGDSTHDMIAGRSAGMQTVAVLTGMALESDLRPYADMVLPHIGHLPAWLNL